MNSYSLHVLPGSYQHGGRHAAFPDPPQLAISVSRNLPKQWGLFVGHDQLGHLSGGALLVVPWCDEMSPFLILSCIEFVALNSILMLVKPSFADIEITILYVKLWCK